MFKEEELNEEVNVPVQLSNQRSLPEEDEKEESEHNFASLSRGSMHRDEDDGSKILFDTLKTIVIRDDEKLKGDKVDWTGYNTVGNFKYRDKSKEKLKKDMERLDKETDNEPEKMDELIDSLLNKINKTKDMNKTNANYYFGFMEKTAKQFDLDVQIQTANKFIGNLLNS